MPAKSKILAEQLAPPLGSRQHFFRSIRTCCSWPRSVRVSSTTCRWGIPTGLGAASGFSFPFFPYCVEEDRPYDVVQIGLVIMDVTLRTYMALSDRRRSGGGGCDAGAAAPEGWLCFGGLAPHRVRRRARPGHGRRLLASGRSRSRDRRPCHRRRHDQHLLASRGHATRASATFGRQFPRVGCPPSTISRRHRSAPFRAVGVQPPHRS